MYWPWKGVKGLCRWEIAVVVRFLSMDTYYMIKASACWIRSYLSHLIAEVGFCDIWDNTKGIGWVIAQPRNYYELLGTCMIRIIYDKHNFGKRTCHRVRNYLYFQDITRFNYVKLYALQNKHTGRLAEMFVIKLHMKHNLLPMLSNNCHWLLVAVTQGSGISEDRVFPTFLGICI